MANVIYNAFKYAQLHAPLDLDTDVIKIALVTSSYTPDQDAHSTFADVTNEVTSAGYVAGGATLAVTVSQDNSGNLGKFTATSVTWTGVTLTARGAVIYRSSPAPTTLICYIDFSTDKTATGVDFTITFNASGILTLA
jgi:hypothetical protein